MVHHGKKNTGRAGRWQNVKVEESGRNKIIMLHTWVSHSRVPVPTSTGYATRAADDGFEQRPEERSKTGREQRSSVYLELGEFPSKNCSDALVEPYFSPSA
jgi:hypothetical protein